MPPTRTKVTCRLADGQEKLSKICNATSPQSPQILSGSKFADFNGGGGIEGEGDSNYSLAVTWPFTQTCTHLHIFTQITAFDLAFLKNLHICTNHKFTQKLLVLTQPFTFTFVHIYDYSLWIKAQLHMAPMKGFFSSSVVTDQSQWLIILISSLQHQSTLHFEHFLATNFFKRSQNGVELDSP